MRIAAACALFLAHVGLVAACSGDDAAAEIRAERAWRGVHAVVTELVTDPGSVYDDASPRLRDDRERISFVSYAEALAEVLGDFEGGVLVRSVRIFEGARGRTARVDVDLSFERATIDGWLSFEEHDGGWRLYGLELPIPESLEDAWDEAIASRGARSAPDEVIDAAHAIVEELSEGGTRAASEEAAAAAVEAKERFGDYVGPARVSWSRIDAAGERLRIASVLEYESGWMRAELELAATGAAETPWRLETLRVVDANRHEASDDDS